MSGQPRESPGSGGRRSPASLLDGAGDILDWHRGIDAVLVEQIDAIRAQALEHSLDGQLDVVGTTVEIRSALAGSARDKNYTGKDVRRRSFFGAIDEVRVLYMSQIARLTP